MGFISNLIDWLFRVPIPPVPPIPPTPPSPDIKPGSVITEINRIRSINKKALVWEDSIISAVSQEWADTMASNNVLTHGQFFDRIATIYPNCPAGEDIAAGQISAIQVVRDWMNDPPHRETILGNYNHVGVGVAKSSRGVLYWVADFVLV